MTTNSDIGKVNYGVIHTVQFYVADDAETEKESNVDIDNKETFKGDVPAPGGVLDLKMGTTDREIRCNTCLNFKRDCPGHFGTLNLNYPCKSPLYREEMLKWLKVICYNCGDLVLPPIKMNIKSKILNMLIKNVKLVKKCIHCNYIHMQVIRDKKKPTVFYRILEENKIIIKKLEFFNHEIEMVLQKIKNETVIKLGKPIISHPSKFIIRRVKVPPNTIRPDIKRIGGARSSNSDTTSLLKIMVEINESLPDEIPPRDQISIELSDMYVNLDMTYYSMIKGGGGGDIKIITNTNKPPVAIAEHFPLKTGRIRRNLMGKHVESMIRSVITGDSRLKVNELGVPVFHAQNLEIPETVTEKNKDRLMIYFNNKLDRYPGCHRIIKKSNGHPYKIDRIPANYELQIGDIVLRSMIDGDYVSFNRQPSLIFTSIAGMKVVIMQTGETLRINPSVCHLFNADFDGDQMHVIACTGLQARNECMNISKVARWLISWQIQAPSMGAFQDGAIGISEFTKDGLYFDKWHAMNMLSDVKQSNNINYTIDFNFTKKNYTNREIVSKLLPSFTLINKDPTIYKESYAGLLKYNPADIKVNIIKGQLISGILDKSTTGQDVMGSIFHIIANEYGNDISLEVIYNLQQLVHQFFLFHGFTVGVGDINISSETMKEVKRKVASIILESRKITQRLNDGKLIAPIGMSLYDFNELEQINSLDRGDDFANPILADINLNTNMMARLILTGSKGKIPNFIDINGALGLLTINGNRFGPQVGWGRTSPYFLRYDTDPLSNGFIPTSYREGISNDVYPFVAAQARAGLIAIGLSTAVVGAHSRISIKNLESLVVDNMRKSVKGMNIIQPLYAECGLDPSKTERVKFPFVLISDEEFEKNKTGIREVNKIYQNKTVEEALKKEFEQLRIDREKYREISLKLEDFNPKEYVMSDSKQMPVNIYRIIDDIVYKFGAGDSETRSNENLRDHVMQAKNERDSETRANENLRDHVMQAKNERDKANDSDLLDPIYAIESVKNLCLTLGYVYSNEQSRQKKREIPYYIRESTCFLQILLRSYLNTKNLIKKKVSNKLLDLIIQKVIMTYSNALIDYGSAVGIIAAQCISEPTTQYILDSKHRSGGQGGTKTNAIVRLQEIMGARSTDVMKNPHMLIMTNKDIEQDKLKVQEISNHIEMLTFNKFIKNTTIFYESYGHPKHPKYIHEEKIIKIIEKHNYGQKIPSDLAKWCVRYTIDREELILKSMKLENIILAIRKNIPDLFIIYTPETYDEIFIRCYIKNNAFKNNINYYENNLLPLVERINNVIIRGIKDIISTSVIDVIKHIKNPNGSLEMKKVYGILSTGSNMTDVLTNGYIDKYRTQSDSIEEIENIYGIVAARNKIINEMMVTLEGLNRIHCTIFADEMTFSGSVTSIQKTGLQKREMSNVSLRLSFQSPVQVIQDAAINGLADKISGISGPLVMGTSFNIGTTYNSFIVNEDFLKENTKSLSSIVEEL